MFTPQEVSEKVFPKASGFGSGYQMSAVDTFLDSLTEDYTALFKDNMALKAKLKVLAEKVEEYRVTEDSMRATLLTAQRMAAKLVQEAQQEKEAILAQAQAGIVDEITRLERQKWEAEQKLVMAQRSLADFLSRSNDLLAAQSRFLTNLPEMQLAQPEIAVPETAEALSAEILKSLTETEDEEVEAEAETAESENTDEKNTIPGDFSLSLDELKFGRNYTIGEE